MAFNINWTPMGCGTRAPGLSEKAPGEGPDFPGDFLPRMEHLEPGIEAVFFAWEIARLAGDKLNREQQRALMLLILAARLASTEGSTRLPLASGGHLDRALEDLKASDEERNAVESLLAGVQAKAGTLHDSPLAEIIGGPGNYRPLIIDHDSLYIQKLHVLEARVGRALRERIAAAAGPGNGGESKKPDRAVEDALHEVFESAPEGPSGRVELDAEQKEAVRTALSGRIAVISGKPGSGKTSIINSVLRALSRTGSPPLESIVLAAPTGKAADRMRQSIAGQLAMLSGAEDADRRLAENCPPALTLHRLLGYSPTHDRFRHDENNPLAEQLVIVDESSMIDLAMMDRLLRALQPKARVVFLGDADQLPSIEAGAVMRDLCRSQLAAEKGRVVVLKKSYRAREEDSSGRRVLDSAAAVNEGRPPAKAESGRAPLTKKKASELIFTGVEHLSPGDDNQRRDLFERWYRRLRDTLPDLDERLAREYTAGPAGFDEETAKELTGILSHYERFRILCVTRVTAGGTGTDAVNSWFHHRRLDELREMGREPGSRHFAVGEPVMVTRNDYRLRLYNGDSGLVLWVRAKDGSRGRGAEPMAVFPRGGGFVAFPLEALRGRLDLAWATTVHKAQGAEYDHVAVILPEVHVRPLTRELLYTALTRAKKSVVFAGPEEVLESGVKRTVERASGLTDMLD